MTPSAARAAVEALANDCRRHTQSTEGGVCQECVVAFAAAQRAEEREALILAYRKGPVVQTCPVCGIRALRVGSG